VKIIPETRRAH